MNRYEENRNELDELIDCIGQWLLEDEQQPSTLQPIRLQMMNFSYSVLKHIAAEQYEELTQACKSCILCMVIVLRKLAKPATWGVPAEAPFF